ncbi:uncharacterized protein LOC111277974 [Durio zibethinus]|uniref:Uncharacterized protein LOC111277974 n=1 Tax=Durio zibethinus TaxID=66656 RepID=A0A6P5WXC2_DURZI|nr:uncharacterized protein LOC111277974 [Durio zibethinus]
MEEFRPSYEVSRGDGGRNTEIIDTNMLKYVNKVYFGRSQPSFDQNQVDKKKKKKSSSTMSIKSWWNEPKMKRKRRLTKYKMYALEGKVKDSLKKGHRWIKNKYRKLVHGY